MMTLQVEALHDLSTTEIDAIEDRIYRHNSAATSRDDVQGLGFVIRNTLGQMIGVAAGYTWSTSGLTAHLVVKRRQMLPDRLDLGPHRPKIRQAPPEAGRVG